MRKNVKKDILEIIKTIYDVHKELEKLAKKKDLKGFASLLGDCQDAAFSIGNSIIESESEECITVSYIEKYQNLEKENVSLENQYSSLSNRLYYTETYTTTSTASDGTVSTEIHTRRVKDRGVEAQMSNVRKKINDNKEEMENLKNRVSNSI